MPFANTCILDNYYFYCVKQFPDTRFVTSKMFASFVDNEKYNL